MCSSPATRAAGSSLVQLAALAERFGGGVRAPLLLGVMVMVAATLAARWSPGLRRRWWVSVLAVVAARFLGFHEREIGAITWMMPPFVGFSWSPRDVFTVIAVGICVGVCFQREHSDHVARGGAFSRAAQAHAKTSDADAELGAYGIANICGGMFGAPLSVGIPARSLAVVRCGGTTRVANLVHAVLLGAILWLGAGRGGAYPATRAGRGYGVDGTVPAGLERVAQAAEDEPRGCGGISGHGNIGAGGQRSAGGGDRLLDLRGECAYVRWVRPSPRVPDLQVP